MKHHFWIRLIQELKGGAVWAKDWGQFKKVFILKLIWCQKPIGDRHFAEAHKWVCILSTYSAVHNAIFSI